MLQAVPLAHCDQYIVVAAHDRSVDYKGRMDAPWSGHEFADALALAAFRGVIGFGIFAPTAILS